MPFPYPVFVSFEIFVVRDNLPAKEFRRFHMLSPMYMRWLFDFRFF